MASVTQALEDTIAHLRVALASAEAALTAVLPSTSAAGSTSTSASVTASSKPQPPLTPAYDTLSTVSVASSVRAPRQHQLQPQPTTQPQLQEYQDASSTVSMMSTASTPRGRKPQNDAWTDNLSRVSAASTVQRSGAAQ